MSNQPPWKRRLIVVAIGALLVFSAVTAAALLTPVHVGPVSGHFDGKHFFNIPAELTIDKSVFEILRWSLTREAGPWSERRDAVFHTPPRKIDAGLRLTFVNHATVLIQTGGLNILTDPMWSRRASPSQWLGPARHRDAGIRFEDLPPIDVVLISHNHYDHMDRESIERLAQQHDPVFLVPLGNSRYLENSGTDKITELDWWSSTTVDKIQIHAVPAQHW
ncbi:MAG: MBL fold metallo-hydrolase, partial [Gammaproteobacteria bacterium]|nr:MBL fold metallo-hydrolase [Gammaproteobacteria bacterium]